MARVLIADDDPNIGSMLRTVLEPLGYEVRVVMKGSEALRILGISPPGAPMFDADLVLLDFEMPPPNGFEVLRQLHQDERARRLPVIMMSATKKRVQEVLNMEATFFLVKPFETARLLELVALALPPEKRPKPGDAPKPRASVVLEFDVPRPEKPARKPAPPPAAATLRIPAAGRSERPGPPDPAAEAVAQAFLKSRLPPESPAPPPPPPAASSGPAAPAPPLKPSDLALRLGDLAKLLDAKDAAAAPEDEERKLLGAPRGEYSPLIKMIDEIITDAVERGASDIHVEPQEQSVRVRVRVDGQLQTALELPAALSAKVAARLKIMANLDIAERRIPQDGRFSFETPRGTRVECRVSTLPSLFGEKLVLRLLCHGELGVTWDTLGLSARDRKCLEASLKIPQGIILVTGPTGSGKTTMLHLMLKTLNTPGLNVVTVEDPVEYRIPGITQVAVNAEIGLTFEKVLRSFLRQDPNVILVGEMRDIETAEIGLRAAVTGHLVLSTLHTGSAPSSVTRLINMGVKPFLIAAAVRLIVAQRLVRLLCPSCKQAGQLTPEETALLTSDERENVEGIFRAGPQGCAKCLGGYSGRRPVFEVMPVESAALKKAIMDGDEEKIRQQAKHEGLTTLRKAALRLVAEGSTSPQEALKVFLSH